MLCEYSHTKSESEDTTQDEDVFKIPSKYLAGITCMKYNKCILCNVSFALQFL